MGSAPSGLPGLSRRDFLSSALLLPTVFRQTSSARFVANVPLLAPGAQPPPFGRLLGDGLDARLFTDLSALGAESAGLSAIRNPRSAMLTPADRFYIRTAVPHASAGAPQGVDFKSLERARGRLGPTVMECAGNSDPSNFGLISAATWAGYRMDALIERLHGPDKSRVLVSGLDDPGPSRTSVPGASWIFSREELQRAVLAVEMNDAPLAPHHGAPMRLVVPGWYGCACIKWVNQIEPVADDAPATTQMREFAARTHQDPAARLASDFSPAVIDTAAMPIRVEQWIANGRLEYRVAGIIWGGSTPTNALSIRFKASQPWVPVDDCPMPASTLTWSLWSHLWRPEAPGRYQIVLRVSDPAIRTRRLDLFFYVREIEIDEI